MDNEQAKHILRAWKTGPTAPLDDALLLQALDLLETDPALAAWYEEQPAFDAKLPEALRAIAPPPHLREDILAASKVVPLPASSRRFPYWLPIAASIVVAVAMFVQYERTPKFATISAEVPLLTARHAHAFDSKTGDLDQIRTWLANHGGAVNFTIPAGLKNLGGVGCEVTSVGDAKVSILCFHTGPGGPAHLYVMDRAQISDPPPEGPPVLRQQGDLALASWSDGRYSYILARPGPTEELSRYL